MVRPGAVSAAPFTGDPAVREFDETLAALAATGRIIEKSLAGQQDRHLAAWGRWALALLAYRQGHLDAAREWAQRSQEEKGVHYRTALNDIVLAMIDLRQGRLEDAARTISEARRDLLRWEPVDLQPEARRRIAAWANWRLARILLREAESISPELITDSTR
jgi:hypothetical protein